MLPLVDATVCDQAIVKRDPSPSCLWKLISLHCCNSTYSVAGDNLKTIVQCSKCSLLLTMFATGWIRNVSCTILFQCSKCPCLYRVPKPQSFFSPFFFLERAMNWVLGMTSSSRHKWLSYKSQLSISLGPYICI